MSVDATQKYSVNLRWSFEDEAYVATSPEFPGLSGVGAEPEHAIAELRSAQAVAIEAFRQDGDPIPAPILATEFSGQFRLRLPRTMHQDLSMRAVMEGVSLNTYVISVLGRDLGRSDHSDRVAEEVRMSMWEIADRFGGAFPLLRDRSATTLIPVPLDFGPYQLPATRAASGSNTIRRKAN
ncbi:MAG: toxin-antitoxin system HicB family antitoxin [Candidatus Eisenbacteria bacterium]|nr:toxin-antitoxin system HicB family antitoxin [Candidatus Eisenbacteria bacterium]